jgi:hypothetical protein
MTSPQLPKFRPDPPTRLVSVSSLRKLHWLMNVAIALQIVQLFTYLIR